MMCKCVWFDVVCIENGWSVMMFVVLVKNFWWDSFKVNLIFNVGNIGGVIDFCKKCVMFFYFLIKN